MGQHKYNPNVQAAKNGELPPKKKKMSKRESERLVFKMLEEEIVEKFYNNPALPDLLRYI